MAVFHENDIAASDSGNNSWIGSGSRGPTKAGGAAPGKEDARQLFTAFMTSRKRAAMIPTRMGFAISPGIYVAAPLLTCIQLRCREISPKIEKSGRPPAFSLHDGHLRAQ